MIHCSVGWVRDFQGKPYHVFNELLPFAVTIFSSDLIRSYYIMAYNCRGCLTNTGQFEVHM